MASSSRLRQLTAFYSDFGYTSALWNSTRRARPSTLRSALAPTTAAAAPSTTFISAFSTSSAHCASVVKAKAGAKQVRKTKSLRLTKKARPETGRRPAPGDRKAARKRIVLSNTNAFEVNGLEDLNADTLSSNVGGADLLGKMMGVPGTAVDSLRAVEAFKPGQGWSLFARPATLMRAQTVALRDLMNEAVAGEKKKTFVRVVHGERLSGKTTLVLQALAMGFVKGWVVVNIPDAMELTNAHTEYGPVPDSKPVEYFQKRYSAQLLQQIITANKETIGKMKVSQKHDLPIIIKDDLTLEGLATLGIRSPDIAWPIFKAVWTELTQPSQDKEGLGRLPILFALDGLAHIMAPSQYPTPDLKGYIHAHDFSMVKHFLSYLSGAKSFPNGGLVLAATSGSNQPASPTLSHVISVSEAKQAGKKEPLWNPYKASDERIQKAMSGVELLKLNGLDRKEAKAIIEYYAASGVLRQTVSDSFVAEKWALSGGGIIGELERSTVRLRV